MNDQVRILVVDDEPKLCHLIEELLKLEDYLVDVSLSNMEALQMIKKNKYQMLITNLKMPGIDGLELIKKARKLNPEIRTIMITGSGTVETAVQSLKHEIDDDIKKPFSIVELKKVVKRTLYIHQVAMENEQLLKDLKKANRKITKLQKKELSK